MNDFLEEKLKGLSYYNPATTTLFEKTPLVKCYDQEGSNPNRAFVTFKLGAIVKFYAAFYNIVYAEPASDRCSCFGEQALNSERYIFEIDDRRCKNLAELIEFAKSLEGTQLNLVQDEVEFMDI